MYNLHEETQMDSIKDRRLITAGDDPVFQALMKSSRRENIVKTIFIIIFLLSVPPQILLWIAVMTSPEGDERARLFEYANLTFGLGMCSFALGMISGIIGERILDWKDARKAKQELEELIYRITKK